METGWRKLIDPDPPSPAPGKQPWALIGFRAAVELGFGIGVGLMVLGFIVGIIWGILMLLNHSF